MNITSKLACVAAAVVAAGLTAAPAQAKTQHCDVGEGQTKVEIDGGPVVEVDLADGTEVCIKAGTQTAFVTVAGGEIENTTIKNRNGKALGISYYVPGEEPEECEPNPSVPDLCES